MFLFDVVKKLDEYEVPYAIVGGHAVALHGAIRGTVDIDFITEWQLENLQKIEKVMTELGLTPRLPISSMDLFKNKESYITEKNLIAWNFVNLKNPIEQIDIIITSDLTGLSIKLFEIQNQKICVLSKEELIKMKNNSAREQDLIDVKALEKLDET
jgi:hypothetical protein